MEELAELRAKEQASLAEQEGGAVLGKKQRSVLNTALQSIRSFRHMLSHLDFSGEISELSQGVAQDFSKLQKRVEALSRQNAKLSERLQAERLQSSERIKSLELQLTQVAKQDATPVTKPDPQQDVKPPPPDVKGVREETKEAKPVSSRRGRVEEQTVELDLEALLGAPLLKKP
jgi:hypothetical protein